MPKAVIDTSVERHNLVSCPDGYVELRRMPYGKWLERQDMAMKMSVQQQSGKTSGEMQLTGRLVALLEFRECIVDHNLEDEAGAKLDFSRASALERLDPRIGKEIGELIDALHEVDEGNSVIESVQL